MGNSDDDPDIQKNNCSFGTVVIERLDPPTPACRPHDGMLYHILFGVVIFVVVNVESVFLNPDLPLSACCYCEFSKSSVHSVYVYDHTHSCTYSS